MHGPLNHGHVEIENEESSDEGKGPTRPGSKKRRKSSYVVHFSLLSPLPMQSQDFVSAFS
jgi:hypothetical protein